MSTVSVHVCVALQVYVNVQMLSVYMQKCQNVSVETDSNWSIWLEDVDGSDLL